MSEYLRAFVIGSSFLIFFHHFWRVATIKQKTYTYESYTLIAPLYLGLMNMISLYLSKRYNLNKHQRYLLITLISTSLVIALNYYRKTYPFTDIEWAKYAVNISLAHFYNYYIAMQLIDNTI